MSSAMSLPPSPNLPPPPGVPAQHGAVRIVTPQALIARDAADAQAREAAQRPLRPVQATGLAAYIRQQFDVMNRHRNSSSGWNDRLIAAQEQWRGKYSIDELQAIQEFGGSEVYARITASKSRGAAAMLREVYLSGMRPWAIEPSPFPTMPDNIMDSIDSLMQAEILSLVQAGQAPTEAVVTKRRQELESAAQVAARSKALEEAQNAERRVDDLLVEGGFYGALADFLLDLTIFPFACMKGPVVRMSPKVRWVNRKAVIENVPRMFWKRVSPFDLWFTPGASDITQCDVIELLRLTRADINALVDVPGYDSKAILEILSECGNRGYKYTFLDTTQTKRADLENREDPNMNESGMFDVVEFHGSVQGSMLLEHGVPAAQIKEPRRDYFVQAWMLADRIIKVQLSPSPRQRHPYYVTSFSKAPGTIVGDSIPDILSDIQSVGNAILRAIVNNASMASGPQIVVDVDQLAPGENPDDYYPWKRWRVNTKRAGGNTKPVDFFQPTSNTQELLAIYNQLMQMADELSAIPRYLSGSGTNSSIGRTASGLAMLMNNASKVLQTVAANVDQDVMAPLLQALYDLLMLTDSDPDMPGALRGDESIKIKGVQVAMQRETERQRQIEMLQTTANPMDADIMGKRGRAKLLRAVSKSLGMDVEGLVPSDEELAARERAERATALAGGGLPPDGVVGGEAGAGAAGAPAPMPGQPGTQAMGMPGQPGQRVASTQLARIAQGSQRGGEQTRPRAPGPRVDLQQQRRAA